MQPAAFDPRLARERCAQTRRAIVGVEHAGPLGRSAPHRDPWTLIIDLFATQPVSADGIGNRQTRRAARHRSVEELRAWSAHRRAAPRSCTRARFSADNPRAGLPAAARSAARQNRGGGRHCSGSAPSAFALAPAAPDRREPPAASAPAERQAPRLSIGRRRDAAALDHRRRPIR